MNSILVVTSLILLSALHARVVMFRILARRLTKEDLWINLHVNILMLYKTINICLDCHRIILFVWRPSFPPKNCAAAPSNSLPSRRREATKTILSRYAALLSGQNRGTSSFKAWLRRRCSFSTKRKTWTTWRTLLINLFRYTHWSWLGLGEDVACRKKRCSW